MHPKGICSPRGSLARRWSLLAFVIACSESEPPRPAPATTKTPDRAPADPAIAAGAAGLQAEIVAAAGAGDIRGPRLGTPLPNVPADVANAFAVAERELNQLHRTQLHITIEALRKSIDARVNRTLSIVM